VTDALPPDGYHPVIVAGTLIAQSLEVKQQNGGRCDTDGFLWAWGNPGAGPAAYGCYSDYLGLAGFDNNTGRAVPKEGVEVRPQGGFNGGWASLVSFFPGYVSEYTLEDAPSFLFGVIPDPDVTLGPRLRAAGFVQDESFFGHPYDWRLSVGDWAATSYPVLKTTIEQACAVGGADKVVLTGNSMAGPYFHSFLSWMRAQDPDWVERHVHALVPVGGPFNGALSDLTAEAAALSESYVPSWTKCPECVPRRKMDFLPKMPTTLFSWLKRHLLDHVDDYLTPITGSWPGLYFLTTGVDSSTTPPTDPTVITLVNGELPAACSVDDGFRSKCGALQTRNGWTFNDQEFLAPTQCAACYVKRNSEECSSGYEVAYDGWRSDLCCERHECPSKEFRASETPEFFRQMGREDSAQMMEHALAHGSTTSDPGVAVHCIFSYNVQTISNLAYTTTEDMDDAIVTMGDGDGSVDLDSLEVCTRWASTEKVYKIPGVTHIGTLGVKQVLDVILAVALNDVETLKAWREPLQSELVTAKGCVTEASSWFNASIGHEASASMTKAGLLV